jgi:signal transduction histidine kinase
LDSPHAVTAFVSAAFLATMVSTALATVFFATLSSASLTVWFSVYFFVGDLLGLLVIVPFFLSVPTYIRWLNLGQRRLVAAFWAFVSLEVLVSLYVFGALPPQGFAPPLPYLVIPIVVAHTIVFGYAGAATAIAAVSFTGVMITPVGAGPFAAMGGTLSQQVASLQIFMGAMAVSVLYLGAYVTAQTHALWRAADLESELVSTSAKAAVMRASGLIAHDLNNFMQVILSAYETKTWPDSLESRLETLSAQLNGLMRLSAQGFELSSTSVLHCVEKLRPVVERLYGEEVILEVRNELSDQQVLANALQIELCLFVLIQNALDAMNPGGKLTIAVGEAEDCVEVSVTDTGPGMSDEIRANLFEPFKTSKQSGTGFGLYAARQAIEEMGGLLYVSETSPRGTTFIIAFHVHHET